jgi:hypothetical protein
VKRKAELKQIFDRAVRSARLSESQTVREDTETVYDSAVRVPVPNARLNLCRRPQTCLRMFQLHEQRPREDVGCTVDF